MPYAPPEHAVRTKARKHGSNRQAKRTFNTGSKTWLAIRQRILERDQYTCQAKGCGRYGDQVDHIDGDSSHNWDDNLQTLCHSCHSSKTMREQNNGRTQSTA